MLNAIRRSGARKRVARELDAALVARARAPVFFAALGVPDTIDGRFDMVVLHAWLVLDRLKALGEDQLAQALTDTLFVGFDEGLRELGTGDMGMGRRLKNMANAFYGRLSAYGAADGEGALADALLRNVFRGAEGQSENARKLAVYVARAREAVAKSDLVAGQVAFGALPA